MEYCAVHGTISHGVLCSSRHYITWSTVRFTALCHVEYCTVHGAMSRGVLCSSRHYITRSTVQFTALCHVDYCTVHGAMSHGVLCSSRHYVTWSNVQFTALCHAECYTVHGAMSRVVFCSSQRRHVEYCAVHSAVTWSNVQFTALCHAEYCMQNLINCWNKVRITAESFGVPYGSHTNLCGHFPTLLFSSWINDLFNWTSVKVASYFTEYSPLWEGNIFPATPI